MSILIAIPIFLLILKAIFFWSARITVCINKVMNAIFFNIYIRFGLEAYMELCLVSLIRFKNFTCDTPSEMFHSVFAALILVSVLLYLGFSLIFLQVRFPRLNTPEAR